LDHTNGSITIHLFAQAKVPLALAKDLSS
jgi:hypothetical protein